MHFTIRKNNILVKMLLVGWLVLVSLIFNYFAYEIEQFNASFRVILTTGKKDVRDFNSNGIPISHSARIGSFISPFYVVHYGLIYSEGLKSGGFHWRKDPSIDYWNVPVTVKENKERIFFFKNAADYIVNNIIYKNGSAHLLYNFDWPYKNYPAGGLKAPWWSGLTDGYAIILLLRAGDYFNDSKYFDAAQKLYKSVLTDTDNGGSSSNLNGCKWIEEYIDPRFNSKNMSFVFNGMIYATYGIEAFELFFKKTKTPLSDELYSCANKNSKIFDLNGWSTYDAIGNSANIKYHYVNHVLLKDMIARDKISLKDNINTLKSFERGFNNPGFFYLYKGPISVSYFHFVLLFLFTLFFPFLFLLKKGKSND